MIEPPRIVQTQEQQTAFIRLLTPRADRRQLIGDGLRELIATLAAQAVEPAGLWFTRHLSTTPDALDIELGVPVAAPIRAVGRVQAGLLPAATVARTVFRGDYDGLGLAWGELMAWISANGHQAGPNLWERYTLGPELCQNPADWRTELNRPLLG